MIGRTNSGTGGSNYALVAQLNYPAIGITITATSGGKSKTAVTDATGRAVIGGVKSGEIWAVRTPNTTAVNATIGNYMTVANLTVTRTIVKTTNTASSITATNQGQTVTITKAMIDGQATFYDLPSGETWSFSDGTESKTATIGADTTVMIGQIFITLHSTVTDARSAVEESTNILYDDGSQWGSYWATVPYYMTTGTAPTTFSTSNPIEFIPGVKYYFYEYGETGDWNALYTQQPTTRMQTANKYTEGIVDKGDYLEWTCPPNPPSELWWYRERD